MKRLRAAIVMLFVTGCLSGCSIFGPKITSYSQARSPDGEWLAFAQTEQWEGPGNSDDDTVVYLKYRTDHPQEILRFGHHYPTMSLKIEWLSATHLNVIYSPSSQPGDNVEVRFQAIKLANIDISAQYSPNDPAKAVQ